MPSSASHALAAGSRSGASNAAPVRVLALGAYLPDRVMTNDDWRAFIDTSDTWIVARTGIRQRRIAAPDQSTADLAVAAARVTLDNAHLRPDEIDEIIVATDTPEVYVPDTAPFVQHRLGARTVPSYTLGGSGCAGFLQAVAIAQSRVQCGAGRVLIVGVELLTRIISWHDRNSCVLFGDAAAGAIVGHGSDGAEILSIVSGTDGSRTELLGLEVGGTRHPFSLDAARRGLHQRVTMDGKVVFKDAVIRMAEAALEAVARADVTLRDVELIVPHQANLRIIEGVAKALRLPLDRFFVDLQDYGNTGSASIPLALWDAHAKGRISPGDLVLATSFGAGFHWTAALLQY
jgi:3-oxoacyl-[acyl-carrier-protein] synthase-3